MSENVQLVNHVVDGVNQLQHLSLHGYTTNLLGEISLCDGFGRDSDRTDLQSQLDAVS